MRGNMKAARNKTITTVISKISDRPANREAALVVIYGHDLGRKHDLTKTNTVIGRAAKADIQVDQESVSRDHAKVTLDGNTVRLKDLKSTNGSYVNDEPIKGDFTLRNGDLIKIGRTVFKFIAGGNIEAAYHDEVYRLTTVDGLTQAFNRRYFEDALEREISRCHRYARALSLLMIDLDRFKGVNDTWGHLAGDHVLKCVASSIRGRTRREDILARYGGEEFCILLPEVELKGAVALADKTRRYVEKQQFEFDDHVIPVTVSIGVAGLTDKLREGKDLIKAADDRLFAAKKAGRNRVAS
jgi:diguanylate cyclase (GGDEF)-like protein